MFYYVGYVAVKDLSYRTLNSVNSLYLIINKINGYFEERKENKYLTLAPTDETTMGKRQRSY